MAPIPPINPFHPDSPIGRFLRQLPQATTPPLGGENINPAPPIREVDPIEPPRGDEPSNIG